MGKLIKQTKLFLEQNIFKYMSDEMFLKFYYLIFFGKKLDLKNPKTFNEKLQWLKLYDRNPDYCKMVDKYEVKKYVADIIGDEYIVPCYGVWDSFDEIDFSALPEQFVLKCTHGCGGIYICKDRNQFDYKSAKKEIERNLKIQYFYTGREWPYKNVKPRVLAEKYIENNKTSDLKDYKFFTFSGVVRALYVATDRQKASEETKFDFFDDNFNHLSFENGHIASNGNIEKPLNFEKMKELSSLLAKKIPHVRVDWYEADGQLYFGELTFFHMSGMSPFKPSDWDLIFGNWLELPSVGN